MTLEKVGGSGSVCS